MITDLETFAARLAAEWQDDDRSVGHLVEHWLSHFLLTVPLPEPDTCADGLSRLGQTQWQIRWYDDGERVLGYLDDCQGYAIPWREVDAFIRRLESCEDDEAEIAIGQLPLAG